ncbi:SusC/RagA family TonB-linked outer membrane protein [Echinicola strongylocentroti]|uniref:SusC/RagA family TonB-linked outer membrane protein n=1 Tax=Echinicola strongylocentroti TaxID=1795355 RepID=A0A2Z4IQF6_9BACT|nr:TonB-dependent receptor [Echinicola strongylocentroti]AWW32868.1 SusC/RagA family TonB-linked outer membrane protein [Echinicola strongylocentroti]
MKQTITKLKPNFRVFLLCGLLWGILILPASAQEMQISGTVKDATTEELIPGVSVLRKGTSSGTITDIDGKYTIKATEGDTLMFSYLGMQSVTRVVDRQVLNISMQSEDIGLDEVVVIGYGTTTKAKMVGAVSSLGKEKLEETPFYNVGSALQGQVPGLVVQNNGGGPGSTPNISIRGAGNPLYVIDGVITTEQDFNTLNSNDIETISFLKDAAATAVYGSKAGNGIVLVTTKRGQEGKINVNYSYNYQISQPTVLPEMMNSYQYALLQNQANAYDGTPPTYTQQQLEVIRTHGDLDTYPDNNWPDMTLKNFAPEQRHNLSLNGGSKRTNYFVSLGYADQGGILKEDVVDYNRLNIRSNVVSTFEEIGLEVGVNINASLENYQEPSAGMYSIWRAVNQNTNPMYRAYNVDGTLAGGGNGDHPLALISPDAGYNRTRDKFLNTQLSLNWEVPQVEGLKFGAMANYRNGDGWSKLWEENVPLYMQDGSLMNQPPPQLTVGSYYNERMYLETSANYQRTFGLHGLDATFVYNLNTNRKEDMSAFRRGYLSGAVDQLFAGPTDGQTNNGTEAEGANAGYVMRVKYDYNYKYILEFSGRYDGNDNFAPEQRWGFFPAVSAAWNVSDEPFMKTLGNRNIINDLKLRVSYGETGVTQGVNRFGYIPVYNLEPNAYNIGNELVNGYSEGELVNPLELTWYTRRSLNYGLDFSSLGGRLSGTLEYFYYRTTGFLVSPEDIYALPLGKDLPQIKSNSAQRRAGFELSLNYRGQAGPLSYEVGGNYSYFNQLWEQLDTENEAQLKNPYIRETHRTDYWGGGPVYITDGLYQTEEDILNNPRLLSSTATQQGDMKYADANGDGKVDVQDKRTVGLPSLPHGTYGVNFSLKYKGWSMSGLFQGTGDRYLAFDNFMIVEAKRRTYEFQQDYWTPDNPNALFPRVSHLEQINGGNNSNDTYPSDFYLKNAKYFRLRNLQIGYDLKHSLLDGADWISNCRVFVNGTNLFTVSPVMDYFDPEQAETGNGVQSYGYPVQRTFAIGVNVGL